MSATAGLAHSIHVRLVARAKDLGIEPQLLLERYALHRLLYRLSISKHVERFLLKGAQLMLLWLGETVRSTRDADLLGFGDLSDGSLQSLFTDLCDMLVPDDGMEYLADTIRISPIREESTYGGRRVSVQARLGNARLHLQVDVGIGDAVTPEPEWVELPQLLDLPAVRLRAYRPETSIAEKLETMVSLGLVNSRMKDYFDIYVLSMGEAFDRGVLGRAVGDTFRRRGTGLPSGVPVGLSVTFAEEPGKAAQWRSFLNRVDAKGVPDDLGAIVKAVAAFLWPVLIAARGTSGRRPMAAGRSVARQRGGLALMVGIRAEVLADVEAIRRVNELAFGRPEEADVAHRLRLAEVPFISLVAEDCGAIAGHILFTLATVDGGGRHVGQRVAGMGLAPLAVIPERQRQGIGSSLVRRGLDLLRADGCPFVVVLGHPEYYPQFGFERASVHGLARQWKGVPDEAFMVHVFDPDAMQGVSGITRHRDEFDAAV